MNDEEEFTDILTDEFPTQEEDISNINENDVNEEIADNSTAENEMMIFKEEDGSLKTCPICLGPLEVATILDKCFHTFCFVCIYQWTQINPTCPLCKSKFTSIIYNICSESEYQQLFLVEDENPQPPPPRPRNENLWGISNNRENFVSHFPFSASHARRKRVYQRHLIPFLPSPKIMEQYKHKFKAAAKSVASSESYYFFLENYQNLQNLPQNYIYCNEEEWNKRGNSWVERELQTITEEFDVSILLCIFKALLKKYHFIVNHLEFRKEIEGYLFHHADIFFRDFCLFLSLPFSIPAFDNLIKYCDIQSKIEQKEEYKRSHPNSQLNFNNNNTENNDL